MYIFIFLICFLKNYYYYFFFFFFCNNRNGYIFSFQFHMKEKEDTGVRKIKRREEITEEVG